MMTSGPMGNGMMGSAMMGRGMMRNGMNFNQPMNYPAASMNYRMNSSMNGGSQLNASAMCQPNGNGFFYAGPPGGTLNGVSNHLFEIF